MRFASRLVTAAAPLFVLLAAPVHAAEPGDRWRITQSMQMGTFSMPPTTTETCVPRSQADAAPVGSDKNCKVVDAKRSGNRQTVKMVCSGSVNAEGTIEIVYDSPTHYKGKMDMVTEGKSMTVTYDGTKIGDCDAAENQRQIAELKRNTADAMARNDQMVAQQCAQGAVNGQVQMFSGPTPICKDPAQRKLLCDTYQSHKGYGQLFATQAQYAQIKQPVASDQFEPLNASGRLCGVTPEAARVKLCPTAEAAGQMDFLGRHCIIEARAVAQRECAGRDFTVNPPAKAYRGFCGQYAANAEGGEGGEGGKRVQKPDNRKAAATPPVAPAGAAAPAAEAPSAPPPPASTADRAKEAADKGVKALKGVFGF